jgi:hypothetical protein
MEISDITGRDQISFSPMGNDMQIVVIVYNIRLKLRWTPGGLKAFSLAETGKISVNLA